MRSSELAIVIPAKNEEGYIGRLIASIASQDYHFLSSTPVIVADANSTDRTLEVAGSGAKNLKFLTVAGGLPACGRNRGAETTQSEFILFIDADVELGTATVLSSAITLAKARDLDCVTVDIFCKECRFFDHLLYSFNNIAQRLSVFSKPFATGMFMLVRRSAFEKVGGFDEDVLYAEDYHLTKRFERKKFAVARGFVWATNRRFKKMGNWKIAKLFILTVLNSHNDEYFRKDHKYW